MTIKGDNSDHKVKLKESSTAAEMSSVAIPSLSNFVFLKARLKNTTGLPILEGNVNVYVDDNYMGVSQLRYRAAVGEKFDLYLGPDQRLQLKRRLVQGDIESSGLFTNNVKVVNKWEIEIANYTGKPVEVVVIDQYPIPADPNIATDFGGSTLKLAKKNANGILTWKPKLKSGQTKKFTFDYSLTFPKEMWQRLVNSQGFNDEEDEMQMNDAEPAMKQKRRYNLERMLK